MKPPAANPPYRLPPRLFDARCKACWFVAGLLALALASFASLDLQWRALASGEALRAMGAFVAEFFPPDLSTPMLQRTARAALETLAMSAVGTALAAAAGLLLAVVAARGRGAALARGGLNLLRSIPELVWAALLVVAAGLGPLAGTLALALHTTGVMGRLLAEGIQNLPPAPAAALRASGARPLQVFAYATLPQLLPQLVSYTLYRWENNIRAATVLGVVGAGGLGQQLMFHLGLFQMGKTATVLAAMLALVLLADFASDRLRRHWAR